MLLRAQLIIPNFKYHNIICYQDFVFLVILHHQFRILILSILRLSELILSLLSLSFSAKVYSTSCSKLISWLRTLRFLVSDLFAAAALAIETSTLVVTLIATLVRALTLVVSYS